MLKKWETLKSFEKSSLKIFDLLTKERRNPNNSNIGEFTILKSNDWVNVIPITSDNEIVFIRQYRHGTDTIELEIPGGLIELGEIPSDAAKRECLEETGFGSDSQIEFLGENYPNPAFLTNKCFTFVWENCFQKNKQKLDIFEDIEIVKIPKTELNNLIKQGKIRHGVILTAFLFYLTRKNQWQE